MGAAVDMLFTSGELQIQATGQGRTFFILTGPQAGLSFVGTLRTETMIDASMTLGADAREAWILDVVLPGPALTLNDKIQEGPDTWKVVRVPNPTYITATWEVVKVEAKDS